MKGHIAIGRLALRREGKMWNAYYMLPTSNEEPILLGSIALVTVLNEKRRQQFVDLMQESLADALEATTGTRPAWIGQVPAPEHEKGGNC